MKTFESTLYYITDHVAAQKKNALNLLKDYIRRYGEIDWREQEEDTQIETTFYCDGYFVAPVMSVYIDDIHGLTIVTDEFEYDEHSDAFTNDTILDVLCSVIGNNEII